MVHHDPDPGAMESTISRQKERLEILERDMHLYIHEKESAQQLYAEADDRAKNIETEWTTERRHWQVWGLRVVLRDIWGAHSAWQIRLKSTPPALLRTCSTSTLTAFISKTMLT